MSLAHDENPHVTLLHAQAEYGYDFHLPNETTSSRLTESREKTDTEADSTVTKASSGACHRLWQAGSLRDVWDRQPPVSPRPPSLDCSLSYHNRYILLTEIIGIDDRN